MGIRGQSFVVSRAASKHCFTRPSPPRWVFPGPRREPFLLFFYAPPLSPRLSSLHTWRTYLFLYVLFFCRWSILNSTWLPLLRDLHDTVGVLDREESALQAAEKDREEEEKEAAKSAEGGGGNENAAGAQGAAARCEVHGAVQ